MKQEQLRTVISEILNMFKAVYDRKMPDVTREQAKLKYETWVAAMSDLPPAEIKAAAVIWISTKKWPPTPADLREIILMRDVPDPNEQWILIRKCFGNRSLVSDLPEVTRRTVSEMGGLSAIGRLEEENARARFIKSFESVVKREKMERLSPVIGDVLTLRDPFGGRNAADPAVAMISVDGSAENGKAENG